MMKIRCILATILALLCSCHSSSIYKRQDAFIIEDFASGRHQNWTAKNDSNTQFLFRPNLYFPPLNHVVEWQNDMALMDERSCYTTEGRIGSCMPLRSCYPTSKLAQLSNLEMWTMITRMACTNVEEDGRQMRGICCSEKEAISQPLLQETEKAVATESRLIGCGVGPAKILSFDEDRIVGGTDAVKNSWPAMVVIKYAGNFICGGSLITPSKILTAAHCVAFYFPWEFFLFTVELGVHVLNPTSDAPVSRRLLGSARHRDYDYNTVVNDIAILTLTLPVFYSNVISPICLPAAGTTNSYADQEAAIVGWGSLNDGSGPLPNVLQQATVKIMSNAECKTKFGDMGEIIQDSMICAAAPGIGSCYGDSGGPLLVRSSPTSPWTTVGITSFLVEICANPDYPVVYTRVSSYSSWISARTWL